MSDKLAPFNAIVLSGGGTRGIMHLGVLHYYFEAGLYDYDKVDTFVGTSIGSAICLTLACGLEPMELFTKLYQIESFFNKKSQDFMGILKNCGLISLDPFMNLIEEIILTKTEKIPTFKELYDMTGKTLIITVTNVTTCKVEYFSRWTTPDLSTLVGVKISCSLPPIFPRIMYNDCWYCDGGLKSNVSPGQVKHFSNVLMSVCAGTDMDSSPDYIGSYIYRLIVIPINTLTELRYKEYQFKDNFTTVISRMNNIPVIGFTLPSDVKMNLFLAGYRDAEMVNTREELVVKGWNWNSSDKQFYDV